MDKNVKLYREISDQERKTLPSDDAYPRIRTSLRAVIMLLSAGEVDEVLRRFMPDERDTDSEAPS